MSDKHLKPYERAARIYCLKCGVDPDERLKIPPFTPAWHNAAVSLIDLSRQLTAMQEAKAQLIHEQAVKNATKKEH